MDICIKNYINLVPKHIYMNATKTLFSSLALSVTLTA